MNRIRISLKENAVPEEGVELHFFDLFHSVFLKHKRIEFSCESAVILYGGISRFITLVIG